MRRTIFYSALITFLLVFTGCSGCDDETGSGGSATANDAIAGDGYDGDGGSGTATGSDGGDGTATADGGTTTLDGGSATASADGGTGGDAGGTGSSSKCPGTKTLCDGTCVSTRLDPENCGGCGNTCTGNDVCNAGQCVNREQVGCPQGMEACGNRCVDLGTNNDHCGDCGESCPADKACNHGDCTDVVDVGPAPNKCTDGGPVIDIGAGGSRKRCSGRVAKTTFRWAICSCDDVALNNELLTDAYDSSKGPYTPGGYGGGVGTNGEFRANNKFWIWGALWTSSLQGVFANNEADIKLQLHSEGPVHFSNTTDVRGNAWVGDDVISEDEVTFHQTLYLPSSAQIQGSVSTNNTVRQPVSVSPVCRRCQAGNQIPVEQIVRNHENNNDNQKIGLAKDALVKPGDKTALRLPCGEYYLSQIDMNDEGAIVTTGHTALYIGSDVDTGNKFIVKPTPGSTLDIFIAGSVYLNNEVEIGSPGYPANTRFYVAGGDGWNLNNKGLVGAYVYALPGGIHANNEYEQYGGLYTQNVDANNKVRIHYDREVLDADKDCPGGTGTGTGGDAGYDTDSGGGTGGLDAEDDADGGGNGGSTCRQKGGSCSRDGDCCAPLVCDNGTCQNTSCKNLYESCSSDGDCCSGTCAGGVCDSG